ncbi:MAG: hypothetical protein AAFN43_01870 [Pseudomonadota bacterium]
MASQLPLDLSHQVSLHRDDLIESNANHTAIAMVDAWPDWPGSVTVLAGPVGSGKTHIASVWAGLAEAQTIVASQFGKDHERWVAAASEGNNLLIEDMGEGFDTENGLFHLLNAIKTSGAFCLITSRSWPREWDIKLPDLRSRLMAAQLVELAEPDDILLQQVMVKLFADRQLNVEPSVVDYCVVRMERSLESAARLVEAIDKTALSSRRMISRNTASLALQELGMA